MGEVFDGGAFGPGIGGEVAGKGGVVSKSVERIVFLTEGTVRAKGIVFHSLASFRQWVGRVKTREDIASVV